MKTTIRLLSAILCLVMLLGCVTIQAADEFDITEMDNLMEEMNGYCYEEMLSKKMEQLSVLVGQFDTEQTIVFADEIQALL